MTKANALAGIMAFVIFWLVVPLLLPFVLGANALAGVLIVIVFVLRTIERVQKRNRWALWVVVGAVVGVLVALLVPQFKPTGLGGYAPIFSAVFGLLLAYMI